MGNTPEFAANAFFTASSFDPAVIIWTLSILVVGIALFTYASYKYQKWRRYKQFETEMKTLGLKPDQEGTLAELVKRHNMKEPVNILYSQRLYDELASAEMIRILGSPGSAQAKSEYINALYEIRDKTYSTPWDPNEDRQEEMSLL